MSVLPITIALLVIVAGCLYLYNDSKKNLLSKEEDELSDTDKKTEINIMHVLKYGFLGALFSGITSAILLSIFNAYKEFKGLIMAGAITLSVVICSCTSIIVQTLRNINPKE